MGLIFITTMILVQPDVGAIFKGALVPTVPNGSMLTVIALIGTTVVPYNFFIHSTAVHERFHSIKRCALRVGTPFFQLRLVESFQQRS